MFSVNIKGSMFQFLVHFESIWLGFKPLKVGHLLFCAFVWLFTILGSPVQPVITLTQLIWMKRFFYIVFQGSFTSYVSNLRLWRIHLLSLEMWFRRQFLLLCKLLSWQIFMSMKASPKHYELGTTPIIFITIIQIINSKSLAWTKRMACELFVEKSWRRMQSVKAPTV